METTQRVKVLGVLTLWLAMMSLSAFSSTGVLSVQLPSGMLSSFDRMGEILPWARLLLAIALAGWVIFRARTEVE